MKRSDNNMTMSLGESAEISGGTETTMTTTERVHNSNLSDRSATVVKIQKYWKKKQNGINSCIEDLGDPKELSEKDMGVSHHVPL